MVLFLIPSGLSLIFGVTRIVNFAHGSFYMLAAYLTYTLTSALPLGGGSFYVAVLLAGAARRLPRPPPPPPPPPPSAPPPAAPAALRFFGAPENKPGPAAPGLAGSVPIA